jgi:hypothetical protein
MTPLVPSTDIHDGEDADQMVVQFEIDRIAWRRAFEGQSWGVDQTADSDLIKLMLR